jgi:hypothetical protein
VACTTAAKLRAELVVNVDEPSSSEVGAVLVCVGVWVCACACAVQAMRATAAMRARAPGLQPFTHAHHSRIIAPIHPSHPAPPRTGRTWLPT